MDGSCSAGGGGGVQSAEMRVCREETWELDRTTARLVPRSCAGKIVAIFLVCIPMMGALTLAAVWFYINKQVSVYVCVFIDYIGIL